MSNQLLEKEPPAKIVLQMGIMEMLLRGTIE